MKIKTILFLMFFVVNFYGCASLGALRSAPDFTLISVGMAKNKVIEKLGRPTHVSANSNGEMFVYEWDSRWDGAPGGMFAYVGFENGKAIGYYTDCQSNSRSFNMAKAWTQIQAADRTTININQTNVNEIK
jgi:RimJ/RimL family protein N-acetyltransferase